MNKKNKFDYDGRFNRVYYDTTSKENAEFRKDFKFKEILRFLSKNDVLCEFGCGDASKLILFKKYVKELWGFDKSQKAISKAKRKYKHINLSVSNSGKIFKKNKFDVTISLYTLEHVENPELFIEEMIRVTKKGGYIINLCPNFGSPLFPSPPIIFKKNILERALIVIKRIVEYRNKYKNRIFVPVNPILNKEWKPDYDTTAALSLERVMKKYKKSIIYGNSFWSVRPYFYILFFLLSVFKPIKFWGANCFFVIKKNED